MDEKFDILRHPNVSGTTDGKAEAYDGVKCHAMFNPYVGRYYVDDKYGVIHEPGDPKLSGR